MPTPNFQGYLDLPTGTYMVRQLQPWFENLAKRQVKAPKVYLRDTGVLHFLLGLGDEEALLSHPRAGASWEGFAIGEVLAGLRPANAWFWGAHGGGEVDLLVLENGRRLGFEMKFSEAPDVSRSMYNVVEALRLDQLFVVCPGTASYPVTERIRALSVLDCPALKDRVAALDRGALD